MCTVFGYLPTAQTVATGQAIPFIGTGNCCQQWANGSITITKPGRYLVQVSASGAATATTSTAQQIQLYVNGAATPGVLSSATSTGADDSVQLSFSAIVEVGRSCACVNNKKTLQVISTGNAFLYSAAQVVITKVG